MMSWSVARLGGALAVAVAAVAVPSAEGFGPAAKWCTPSQPCWPSSAEIAALAAACDGEVVPATSTGFANASHVKNLRFNTNRPALVLEARSLGDIKRGLGFIRKHGMRLSVMSTGHDYDGRSTAPHSVMISLKQLRSMVPMPATDGSGDTWLKLETGNTFGRIYEFVDTLNGTSGERLVAVGGSDGGVGIGGWTLGGGHSALSRMFGLGVDNVVQFEVVLADGTVAIADATRNPELFWALRGGGGGTFGIVANMTLRLRKDPGPVTILEQICPKWNSSSNPHIGRQAALALEQVMAAAPDQLSGYPQMLNPDRLSGIAMAWELLYFGPQAEAEKVLTPLTSLPAAGCPHSFRTVDRYYLYTRAMVVAKDRALYMVSSVFDEVSLTRENAVVKAAEWVFTNSVTSMHPDLKVGTGCSLNFGTGGAAARIDSNSTALHPSFRKGVVELSCYANWNGNGGLPDVNTAMDAWADTQLNPLGDGAAYFNEPQSDRLDWKEAFWGASSRYERLLDIKKRYDPLGMFYCHHCVGDTM